MKRFFGVGKQAPVGPSLTEATQKVDTRIDGLDERIRKLDAELIGYREKLKKTRDGPAKNSLQQKALRVLKQKKMYEQQREQLAGQSFNMQQADFAHQSMKDTVVTVNAMKQANVSLKKELKGINIDDIENMQDDMADLLETTNEIQDSLARSYFTPEFDESELDDELNALTDELSMEDTPSYLSAASSVPSSDPNLDYGIPSAQTTAPLSH